MGTRGAVGFRANNQDKVQYNHFDSYPAGLGSEVLAFIQSSTPEKLKEIANRIVVVDQKIPPTDEQIAECADWTDLSVSERSTSDWYCVLRKAQGNLGAYVDGLRYMLNAESFLLDSLFCEYAYIINTDENVLEFYSGFNQKARKNKGRYAGMQPERDRENSYYGVALIKKYPLAEIMEANDEKLAEILAEMDKKAESFYKTQERQLKKEAKETGEKIMS
jgi:hypothetical protein